MPINFTVDGPGRIAGIDNGSPTNHESYQGTSCKAFQGSCTAVVKATGTGGKILLKASAQGLTDATLEIDTAAH